MKTAGVVLDFYDDLDGELLKRSFPTSDVLPDIVKTAHILSPEERDVLRDEAYALILVNEGKVLRKFACVDAGNTLLSALYFLENKDRLPEEAQKVASRNIVSACEEFDLPIRDLEKIAAKGSPANGSAKGSARSRDPERQPLIGDDANWAERTNLVSVRGGADSGRVVPMANQMKTASTKPKKKGEKVDYLNDFHRLNPEAKPPKKKEAFDNRIDVSNLNIPIIQKMASANNLALGKYPLGNYIDVERAVGYFSENYLEMSPKDRHEFAVKTASRANELGIHTTDILDRYGSTEYSPDVDAHLANRRVVASGFKPVWDELQEKRASIEPDEFARLLTEADESSGVVWFYGGDVADAYYATFGGNRIKEASVTWSWQSRTGDYISGDQLKRLALNGRPLVEKQFDRDLALAFAKNPISIFESLPDTHKTILSRLASQEFDNLPTN